MTRPGSGAAHVAFEEGGAIARVVFDGGKGNVLDRTLLLHLAGALREASAPGVKAVLLEGAGDHFSFGASVEEHRPEKVRAFLTEFHAFVLELVSIAAPPRIAVLRGQCLGGGLELALTCQRLVAAADCRLGQPEIKLAVFAPVASLLLPIRIGQAAADDLLLTGRSVTATEALALTLLDQVAEDPLEAARAWVRQHLLPLSASSLWFAAQAAHTHLAMQMRSQLAQVERLYLEALMPTHDAVEGIAAFLEKRPARYNATPARGGAT